MNRDDYLALLREALATPHGVALEFGDWVKARTELVAGFTACGVLAGVLGIHPSTT